MRFNCKKILIVSLSVLLLSGCATTQMQPVDTKRNLDVKTKMSNHITLKRTKGSNIFVSVQNDRGLPNLSHMITKYLEKKGYKLVDKENKADYLLHCCVRQSGEANPDIAEEYFGHGCCGNVRNFTKEPGGPHPLSPAGIKGIISDFKSFAKNESVDVRNATYTALVDIQVSGRNSLEEKIYVNVFPKIKDGYTGYRSRILSVVNGRVTNFEAENLFAEKIADSITGIFQ